MHDVVHFTNTIASNNVTLFVGSSYSSKHWYHCFVLSKHSVKTCYDNQLYSDCVVVSGLKKSMVCVCYHLLNTGEAHSVIGRALLISRLGFVPLPSSCSIPLTVSNLPRGHRIGYGAKSLFKITHINNIPLYILQN